MMMPSAIIAVFVAVLAVNTPSSVNAQNDTCTVCAGGADTITPNAPCDDLASVVAGMLSADTSCKNEQLKNYQTGCCPDPPFEYCPICPDGSAAPGLTNKVPIGDFADPPTCEEIQYRKESLIGVFEDGVCSETFLQRGSFYCDCPGVEQGCWLCPDKGEPGNPDRGDAWATNSNCRGLQYLFSVFSADECADVSSTFGVDLAAFCECGGVNETADPDAYTCSLCENGGTVKDPSFIYTNETDVYERTCGQAQDYSAYITTTYGCRDLLARAREKCECTGGSGAGSLSSASLLSLMVSALVFVVLG
jgi:hypothetical protein